MLRFVASRLLAVIPVLFVVSCVVFLILRLAPGDPAAVIAGRDPQLERGIEEVLRRIAREPTAKRPVISSWSALLAYVRVALQHEPREQFRVLYLDKKNQLIADEVMNHGTVDHAPVYPREVVRRALELSASAIIMVHNHPSGDTTPSRGDSARRCATRTSNGSPPSSTRSPRRTRSARSSQSRSSRRPGRRPGRRLGRRLGPRRGRRREA